MFKPAVVSLFALSVSACGSTAEEMQQVAGELAGRASGMNTKMCRAELASNIKTIKEAEVIYDAENDAFVAVEQHPAASSGSTPQAWGSGNSGFNSLNWRPSGKVAGVYSVTTSPSSSANPGGDFRVVGKIDCDGDGVFATYTATKSLSVMMTTPNSVY